MKSPLSVLIIRYGPPADSEPFVNVLRKSFLGVESGQAYTASDYELLDPLDFRVFLRARKEDASEPVKPNAIKKSIAEQSEAVLIVLLLSVADQAAEDLVTAWANFANDHAHCFLLAVSLATPARPSLPLGADSGAVALGLDDLNERDLRCDLLSLHAMNRALHLFAQVANDASSAAPAGHSRPKLFISHAKRDGVPLAISIGRWIKDLGAVDFFYDTKDLDVKGDISAQLEQAVSGSILIVLRTEIFDQRYWCQKEIYWAEKHGVPVLAVDGRWSLQQAPSVIVFDSSPSVRIPDGSMIRILLAAMIEALRVAFLRVRVRQTASAKNLSSTRWTIIPRFPSLGSLHSATERLKSAASADTEGEPVYVFHPNPALPDGLREVAAEMATARLPACRVLSLDELRVLPRPP